MTTRVSYNLKDALLISETPFHANSGVALSEAFDLEDIGQRGVRTDPFELLLHVGAATAAQLPAGATNTFSFQFFNAPNFVGRIVEISAGSAISCRSSGSLRRSTG